jgi:integrase
MASYQNRGTKKKPSWQYVISHKPKPIRKGGFRSKKEAQIAGAEVEAELTRGVVPHLKPELFDGYFATWIKLFKTDISKNTLERYHVSLKTIEEHFRGVPIQNINKRSYQKFLNEYGQSHSKESGRKLNTHIRACVKEAIDEGIIRVDFTRDAVITGKKPKRAEEKHLNFFESKRLLNELYQRLDRGLTYYLLLLGLTSGLRFAELVGLTRNDFDFKNNKISINKTWGYTKRMSDGFGETKNEQSIRTVKMDKRTMSVFEKLFETVPENIHGLVFYSPQSKYKVISNNNANKVLKNLLEKLNIASISAHGLRHTHASVLLYRKVSIYYVSERLGHKNIETTLKYYAHVVKELRERDEKDTVDTFEKMAG